MRLGGTREFFSLKLEKEGQPPTELWLFLKTHFYWCNGWVGLRLDSRPEPTEVVALRPCQPHQLLRVTARRNMEAIKAGSVRRDIQVKDRT
jgi:hypothetical protein